MKELFPIANLTVGRKVKNQLLLHLMTDTFKFGTMCVVRCVDNNKAVFSQADGIILTLQGVNNL